MPDDLTTRPDAICDGVAPGPLLWSREARALDDRERDGLVSAWLAARGVGDLDAQRAHGRARQADRERVARLFAGSTRDLVERQLREARIASEAGRETLEAQSRRGDRLNARDERRWAARRALREKAEREGVIDVDPLTGQVSVCRQVVDRATAGTAGAGARDTANNVGSEVQRRARRTLLWKARGWLWGSSTLSRVRACGRNPVSAGVSVGVDASGEARVVGVQSCGSVWCCPVCSSRIDGERADELREAIANHTADGGKVFFLTLTMRHKAGEALADLWDGVSKAWTSAMGVNRSAREAWQAVGKVAWVRRVEVTHGENGWHVHVHALVFVKGEPADLPSLERRVFAAWRAALVRQGFGAPTERRGIELRDATGVEDVGGYMAKGYGEGWSIANEVGSGSSKLARGTNRTPFEILAELQDGLRVPYSVETADVQTTDARLWREWEAASHGRRAMTWSKGGRQRVLGSRPEFTDEQLADWTGVTTPVVELDNRVWRGVCDAELVCALMSACEVRSAETREAAIRGVLRAARSRAGP